MEAFKVSSIFSFCHCISKASDKSHGSVIVLYIYFTFYPSLSQQEHSFERISELWCCLADAGLLLVSIQLPQETVEYYYMCALLSAVASSII